MGRRTQRGGLAGKSGKKSRLLPIALWLQRRMEWLGSKKTYKEMRVAADTYSEENGQLPQWDDAYNEESWATLHTASARGMGTMENETGGSGNDNTANNLNTHRAATSGEQDEIPCLPTNECCDQNIDQHTTWQDRDDTDDEDNYEDSEDKWEE
ncbi:hypothetical protein ACA910_019986 [Epithemia clementina (nom. ined.)]